MDRNPYIPLAKVRHCESLSARRAWIEIIHIYFGGAQKWSLSARRAWIEIVLVVSICNFSASLSARRAWIEIIVSVTANVDGFVALRKESVDRNEAPTTQADRHAVALRKESVDRNSAVMRQNPGEHVALRKESVDRNRLIPLALVFMTWSLSARRAWIEILISARQICLICVALRKESVDRNEPSTTRRLTNMSRSPQGERG